DNPVLDNPVLDNPVLDNPVLDNPVLDKTVLDKTVLDKTVLDKTVLDKTVRSLPAGASPRIDYLALSDGRSYEPVLDDDRDFRGTAVLAVAARVGTTRLIDNVLIDFGTEPHAADD
ncbi:MAG: pantoate--beta-alanine ligase, partial [Trebonia sp.]